MATDLLLSKSLALGLLTHQMVYFAQCGASHFIDDFMPLCGWHLSAWLRAGKSVLIFLACVSLICFPSYILPRFVVTALLLVEIAFFPCRLPNHLVVALSASVLLVIVAVVPDEVGFYYGLSSLLCTVYAASGVHKVNRDFLHAKRSCASLLALLWCKEKRIACLPVVAVLSLLSIYGAVATELYLAFAMASSISLFPIIVAILIHIAFGLLCHVHFSVIMFSILLPFLNVPYEGQTLSASACALMGCGALGGVMLGGYSPFRHPWLMSVVYSGFGAGSAAMLHAAFTYGVLPAPSVEAVRGSWITPTYFVPAGLMILSVLGPYTGLKTEFSLAMFSNLRPDVRNHCFLPQRRAQRRALYVTFDVISGSVYSPHCCSWRHAWVLRQLQDWQRSKYSPYFVVEALHMLETATHDIDSLRFSGVIGEERFIEYSANQIRQLMSRHLMRAFYPAVLSQDTLVPYIG